MEIADGQGAQALVEYESFDGARLLGLVDTAGQRIHQCGDCRRPEIALIAGLESFR